MRHGDVILSLQWRLGLTCGQHEDVHLLSFPGPGTGVGDRNISHGQSQRKFRSSVQEMCMFHTLKDHTQV